MTRRFARVTCSLAVLLLTASCWIDSIAHEIDPLIPARPPTVADWRREAAEAGTEGAGVVPGEADAESLALPDLDQLPAISGGSLEPPLALLGLLPGGFRAAIAPDDGPLAWIRLTIPNRTLPGSEVGIAEVTAHLIAESPLHDPERPALRTVVESAGGSLRIEADVRTTRFTIAAPRDDWQPMLARLIESIEVAPAESDLFQEIRDRVARDMTQRYAGSPATAAAERVSAFEGSGPTNWIATTQDVTPSRIAAFHAEAYRANGSVLAARVPAAEPENVLTTIREATTGWATNEPRLLPDPVPLLPPARGVFWAEAPGESRVVLIFDVASTSVPDAPARLTALELLTASGSGGRLAEELAKTSPRAIDFRPRLVSNSVHRRIELSATVPADLVPTILAAVRAGIRSCLQRPPTIAEIEDAATRARLRLAVDLREPEGWLDEVTRGLIGGARPDVLIDESGVQPFEGEAPHPWLTTLDALERPGEIDTKPVFEQWADISPLMLVLGGEPGEFAAAREYTRMPDAFLPVEQREAIEASPEEQTESARGYLELALTALGGRDRISRLHGFRTVADTRSGRGPRVRTQMWYRDDGRLRLAREVLASTIETYVEPHRVIEFSGEEQVVLRPEDARPLLDIAARHPLMLLAEYARGRSQYRLVSLRPVEDRVMAVLERISDAPQPLRVELDTGSGLIRAVVAAEARETGRVYLREEFRDYRTVSGGVRAPFHRSTFIDDGVVGLATEWESFEAVSPDNDEFAPPDGR